MKLQSRILTGVFSASLLLGGVSFGTTDASALPLWPSSGLRPSNNLPFPGTSMEDDNLDYLDNKVGSDETIEVGDVLVSVIEYGKAIREKDGFSITLDTANDELVALAQIKLLGIDEATSTWYFGQIDTDTPMVQFYTTKAGGSDLDVFLADKPLEEAKSLVTDGTLLWSFSIDPSDADTFWVFNPLAGFTDADNVGKVSLAGGKIGSINYALNFVPASDTEDIFSNLGLSWDLSLMAGYYKSLTGGNGFSDGIVDLYGSGDIIGGNEKLTYAFARSDTDIWINPVPEPATMTLFGLGLAGLGFLGRRRARK